MNSNLRSFFLCLAIMAFLFPCRTAIAAFKATNTSNTNAAVRHILEEYHSHRQPGRHLLSRYFIGRQVPIADDAPHDGYKGIVALASGAAGAALLILALLIPAAGLVVPAFFLGVGGIVFGAMKKKSHKLMGRAGLVFGALDVVLIVVFVAAVIVALSMFT